MTANKRIFLNTLATYGRSLFALALGLFSARWILAALGPIDYGLYGVVGSIIVFITFFNGVLGSSVARFYAYAIGQGESSCDQTELQKWFNAALSIHVCVPIVLVAIGYPIGIYAIEHWLTIPAVRVTACIWVFRISLVTAFVSMVSIPFVSMYTAHQNIVELSFWGMLSSLVVFVGAWGLLTVKGDKLISYAVLMMSVYSLIPIIQIVRAFFRFKACRINMSMCFDSRRRHQIFSFAGWQLFGNCGAMFRNQACAVLTNIYFGPKINAAYTIANQVTSHTGTLSQALISAFTPAVTTAEGAGDRQRMINMAWRTSRYGAFLILIFIIPLALEIDEVLVLWLKNPPEYAASLCLVAFAEIVFNKLTVGNQLAISAQGKIAVYQMVVGGIMIATLPIAWILSLVGVGPKAVVLACLVTSIMASGARVIFTKIQLGMSIRYWVCKVAMPICILTTGVACVAIIPSFLMEPSLVRVLTTTVVAVPIALIFGAFMIVDHSERAYVWNAIVDKMRR